MADPQRQEMWGQPQPVGIGIGPAGEVLRTHEGDSPAIHHQLPGVGRTDAHHEVEIGGAVGLELVPGARQRLVGDARDVDILQQSAQVVAIGAHRLPDDPLRVR
jgi:hypothetical protein